MSKWIADRDAPLSLLSVKEGFQGLSSREQRYAHYMSKASHAGTRVVLRQVSHESEAIFDLILAVHRALDGQYPSDDANTQLYLDYVTQFLSNLGNYKSFGDSKFIPGCSRQFLLDLVHLAGLTPSDSPKCSCPFDTLQELIDKGIYGIDDTVTFLGYPAEGFVSSYYLGEKVSQADMKMLKEEVFASLGILPENTRINKISDKAFEVWIASAAASNTIPEEYPTSPVLLPNGATVSFKFGDHSREMNLIASYLQKAKENTANERQSQMLEQYIKHFSSGSSQAHKEAQKLWVKDLSPAIETNIGFIETYREPSGIIGEFESLVAIQNKQRTAKFTQLVQNAQEFIALLPWGKEWEKPVFNPPDFTSIEVLTFTGSGIPAGINIPNYDDVRINIGFKNVSLGNILSASLKATSERPPSFIAVEDRTLYTRYQGDAFEIQVGIHELLGHGSGKLLCEVEGGFNFDHQNPPLGLDGKPVTTFYKLGETWGSKFGPVAGPFEECRAEVVAMYLITNRKILEIFGFHSKDSQDAVIHVAYLQMCRAGLLALEFWDPSTGKWGQPHMQARFSIMKTFLMHSPDPRLLRLVESADGKDLDIKVNSNLIESAGQACIEDYLRHLHILKCSGDFEQGAKYFADRCAVPAAVAKLREMVISKRLPRRQFIQSNTCVSDDGQVKLQEYNEHPLGMLQSFIERDL